MRVFSIVAGIVLLLGAVGGGVCWVTGFEMFKEMLVDGVPVFFSRGGSQTQIPGRLVGALVLIVPIAFAVGGVWLLRSGFDREVDHDT
jgi:hypothetical protein